MPIDIDAAPTTAPGPLLISSLEEWSEAVPAPIAEAMAELEQTHDMVTGANYSASESYADLRQKKGELDGKISVLIRKGYNSKSDQIETLRRRSAVIGEKLAQRAALPPHPNVIDVAELHRFALQNPRVRLAEIPELPAADSAEKVVSIVRAGYDETQLEYHRATTIPRDAESALAYLRSRLDSIAAKGAMNFHSIFRPPEIGERSGLWQPGRMQLGLPTRALHVGDEYIQLVDTLGLMLWLDPSLIDKFMAKAEAAAPADGLEIEEKKIIVAKAEADLVAGMRKLNEAYLLAEREKKFLRDVRLPPAILLRVDQPPRKILAGAL